MLERATARFAAKASAEADCRPSGKTPPVAAVKIRGIVATLVAKAGPNPRTRSNKQVKAITTATAPVIRIKDLNLILRLIKDFNLTLRQSTESDININPNIIYPRSESATANPATTRRAA